MKKILATLVLMTALCSSAFANEAINGFIFKEAMQPGGGSGSVAASKVGVAQCKSYFSIVAVGDCSLTTAMKKGKITNLSHYDEEVLNILGFKTVKVKAYGQ